MKTVILGQIPNDFSLSKHIPLGAFCFQGREDIYDRWEDIVFEDDLFKSDDSLRIADDITNKFALDLIYKVYPELNKINSLNYSFNFWRILLFPWVIMLVQMLYERENRVLSFIAKNKSLDLNLLLIDVVSDFIFKDTNSFIHDGVYNSVFNEWIYSKIFEIVKPDNWKSEYHRVTLPREKASVVAPVHRFNVLKSFLKKKIFKRCNIIYGCSIIDTLIFELILRFKKDRNIENNICDFKESNKVDFILDIEELFWRFLPLSFKNMSSKINGIESNFFKGKVNLGTLDLMYGDNYGKIKLALAKEHGEKLYSIQHGGHLYGSGRTNGVIYNIEYNNDAFITWGFSEQEDYKANFIPLPSPLLSKLLDKHETKNDDIIFIGTAANLYHLRFFSMPQANQWLQYRKNKSQFLDSLNTSTLSHIQYRPFFDNNGSYMNDLNHIKTKYPNMNIVYGELDEKLMKCKLLVMDYPGTTLNKAFAANIPVVCFWDKDSFALSKQSIPYFEKLVDVGILYYSSKSAAQHIEDISDSVSEWWDSEKVQNARKAWMNQYAFAKKSWRKDWIRFLFKN